MAAKKHTDEAGRIKWDSLRIMLALGRAGSLSGAARALGVDHTTIARHLQNLEEEIGAPLFAKSAEGFAATSEGEEILLAAAHMEEEMLSLARKLDGAAEKPSGPVRLTAPPFFCSYLPKFLPPDFCSAYPNLQLELIGDSRRLDLSRREADAAIRLARPQEPELVARRLGEMRFAWYAAAGDGRAFAEQNFLAYDETAGHEALLAGFNEIAPVERVILRSNMTQTLLEAARAGLGCAVLPCFAGDNDAALRRITAPGEIAPLPLWLVYHEDLRKSPRLRAAVRLIDIMLAAASLS